jgi:hypothetical protein
MEEKDPKTEVAEQQPAEQAKQPENNQMSTEAVMQMVKHMWPDTNEQKEKEYWRNLHKELIYHYEMELKMQGEIKDYNELVSNSITYARFVMNEIQAYERGDYKRMFEQNQPNTNN